MNLKRGQIWVETVLYTVIILSIIALVLAFTLPAINKQRDELVVDQSIEMLKIIDAKIKEVMQESGSIRLVDLTTKRGYLYVIPSEDKLTMRIEDLSSLYSEPNVEIRDGNVFMTSYEGNKKHSVNLSLIYNFNIQFKDQEETVRFIPTKLSYKLIIENKEGIVNIREDRS